MTDHATYLTKDGFKKLQTELDELIHVRRKELANRIQEAKELGDLSENAEYQEAKNEQGFNEGRIEELENILKQAVIIDHNQGSATIQVGSTVQASSGGKTLTLYIVGSNEADPLAGRISNESPLGQALLGRKAGEQISVPTPKGQAEYSITKIL